MLDDLSPLPELDLLVVAPHPDDAEISAGGLLLKAKAEGRRVGVLDLTDGEPTPHGSVAIRAAERAAATEILGLDWRGEAGLPNRRVEATLEARRVVASVFRRTRAKLILAPYWEDAHPDHVAATQLIEAARFWSKLSRSDLPGEPWHPPRMLYYFSIHLRIHPQPTFVLDISDEIETKLKAVRAYHSQFTAGRPAGQPNAIDDIHDRARYWGWAIQRRYGEPFASRESLGVRSVGGLDLFS
jgi:bacillithiol biosynthesis deacetylase BshB1